MAAGLLTALFLAFAPFHVRYSQELRPYSLGLFTLCLSMLLLDLFLERQSWPRLAALFLSFVATMYSLYLATLTLVIAAYALLLDQMFSRQAEVRARARKVFRLSPLFLFALFIVYLPWLPVVIEASQRGTPAPAPPFTWERLTRSLAFFAFAPDDGQPLGRKGPIYVALVGIGLGMAVRRRALRFLAMWLIGGCTAIEVLEHVHPHWYVTRHFLAAGLVTPSLAALPLAWIMKQPAVDVLASLLRAVPRFMFERRGFARLIALAMARAPLALLSKRRVTWILGAVVATLIIVLDVRSLAVYFREGRPDWRTLGHYLNKRPKSERVFTENQYSQLCVAFYTAGPGFLFRKTGLREVYTLDREPIRLSWSWLPNTTAWLVLAGPPQDERLRQWSTRFPAMSFPKAEGAILKRLDPALWAATVARLPAGKTPLPP